MFVYEKKLQYPVKIAKTDPKLASIIISQYGGAYFNRVLSLLFLPQYFPFLFHLFINLILYGMGVCCNEP